MSLSPQQKALLRKKMDGPSVPWTVGDAVLQLGGNSTFMTYHIMTTPWALATPVGCLLGAGYSLLFAPKSAGSAASLLLRRMATGGVVLGGLGAGLGLTVRTNLAWQGAKASTSNGVPWDTDGIQQRVNGLSHNFKVRVLDLSAWNGIGAAVATLTIAGVSPLSLGLAPGPLGILQTLTLGSSLGSIAGLACIYTTTASSNADFDDEDDV